MQPACEPCSSCFVPVTRTICTTVRRILLLVSDYHYRYCRSSSPILVCQHLLRSGRYVPQSAVATITGLGGMAGGIGSFLINKGSGTLFTYADETQMIFMGFEGKAAGYFIIFCICAVAYLIGWCIMKLLVPKYKPIVLN